MLVNSADARSGALLCESTNRLEDGDVLRDVARHGGESPQEDPCAYGLNVHSNRRVTRGRSDRADIAQLEIARPVICRVRRQREREGGLTESDIRSQREGLLGVEAVGSDVHASWDRGIQAIDADRIAKIGANRDLG